MTSLLCFMCFSIYLMIVISDVMPSSQYLSQLPKKYMYNVNTGRTVQLRSLHSRQNNETNDNPEGNTEAEEAHYYPPAICECSEIYDPVCGSNEKSYYNKCQMDCELGPNSNATVLHIALSVIIPYTRSRYPGKQWVKIRYEKAIQMHHLAEPWQLHSMHSLDASNSSECNCPRVYSPICAFNGITYVNECISNCLKIQKRREGPCIKYNRRNMLTKMAFPTNWNNDTEKMIQVKSVVVQDFVL